MRNAQLLMQAYSQAPWRKQMQVILWFSLSVIMISLLVGLYLNVSARAATHGREIQGMQAKIRVIQRTNADLEAQLAFLTSASVLEERIQELQLQPASPEQLMYVVVDSYIPRQPANLAPPAGPAVASSPGITPEFSQSLVDWLKEELNAVQWSTWLNEVFER